LITLDPYVKPLFHHPITAPQEPKIVSHRTQWQTQAFIIIADRYMPPYTLHPLTVYSRVSIPGVLTSKILSRLPSSFLRLSSLTYLSRLLMFLKAFLHSCSWQISNFLTKKSLAVCRGVDLRRVFIISMSLFCDGEKGMV
jgi:hypothetical protein